MCRSLWSSRVMSLSHSATPKSLQVLSEAFAAITLMILHLLLTRSRHSQTVEKPPAPSFSTTTYCWPLSMSPEMDRVEAPWLVHVPVLRLVQPRHIIYGRHGVAYVPAKALLFCELSNLFRKMTGGFRMCINSTGAVISGSSSVPVRYYGKPLFLMGRTRLQKSLTTCSKKHRP